MENEKHFFRRTNFLIGAYVLCLLLFVGILYDAQIVNGADYLSQSTIQVTTTQIVESSRGIITDRNGKILVSNREIYTVTFDLGQVKDGPATEDGAAQGESAASALLRLLRLLQSQGLTWEDGLPVSTAAPYAYTFPEATGTQRVRFQNFLADRGWSSTEITPATKLPLMSESLQKRFEQIGRAHV